MDLPDPVEAIKYRMDENGLQPRDLIPFIGSRNRVHEVLNRRRSLTLKMIWRLHEGLGIPAESLIKVGPARAATRTVNVVEDIGNRSRDRLCTYYHQVRSLWQIHAESAMM